MVFFVSENQNQRKIQPKNKAHLDKNSKLKSIQVMQNFFSYQAPFKFLKSIH